MRMRVAARPQAARPIAKRTNAIWGPGRRAAASLVASAITANTRAAVTRAATAGGRRKRYFFFFGLLATGLATLGGAALATGFAPSPAGAPPGTAPAPAPAGPPPPAVFRCHSPST